MESDCVGKHAHGIKQHCRSCFAQYLLGTRATVAQGLAEKRFVGIILIIKIIIIKMIIATTTDTTTDTTTTITPESEILKGGGVVVVVGNTSLDVAAPFHHFCERWS